MKKIILTILSLILLLPTVASAITVFPQSQLITVPYGGVIMSTTTANGKFLQASTSPTFNSFTATSTTLTSYIGGILKVVGNFVLPSLSNGCLNVTSGIVGSTGTSCGGSGGTGVGTIATSSSETAGQIGVFSTTAGYPAKMYSIATSTPTVTAPITYSGTLGAFVGGVTGTFGCTTASAGVTGCLSGTDWSVFNNKISSSSLSATSPIFYNSSTGVISSQAASSGQNGYLTSTDWSTFNSKGSGSVTSVATDSTLTGGTITTTGTLGINLATANTWTATATTTWTGANRFGNVAASKDNLLNVDCTGRVYPASVSVGGCVNLDNGTVNTGPALVVHANVNNIGTGRMVVFNQENSTVTQDMILASSSCANCTALNLKGVPTGKGILKCEHFGGPTGYSNGSCISIDTSIGDAQGIFIKSGTGIPLNVQNSVSSTLFKVDANGNASTTGYLAVAGTGTSTFAGGIQGTYLNLTGTSATSTASNGFSLSGGCYAINGVCLGGGGTGTVTSVGLSDSNSTLTIGSTPITTSGTITATINLAHPNTWTGLQQFNNSTSTLASLGTTWFTGITGSTQCLHVDTNGKLTGTGSDCGAGAGGGISDPFTHPVAGQSATSSVISLTNKVSIGTPNLDFAQATIATSTVPQLALGSGTATTSLRAVGNHFYIASSTSATATSTINAFDLNLNAGVSAGIAIGTSTPSATLDVVGAIVSEESSTTPSATPTFDWSLSNQYRMMLTANVTAITFSKGQPGAGIRLIFCQDSTGSRTVAGWPAGTYWSGATAPTMTSTVNKCDLFTFTVTQGTSTTNYLGGFVQNF